MTAKYEKQILKLAVDRGWQVVRKGGHNQIIIEFPRTGARTYLWASPRTRPSPRQMMAKLVGLENSTSTKIGNDILEWVCDRYGIPEDGAGVVTSNYTDIIREYLGRDPKDKREGDRLKNALTSSSRVFLLGIADRGTGAKTPRLFLGKNATLNDEQLGQVRSWPQVNKVFDDLPSVTERLAEMNEFILSRGFIRLKSGYYSHKGKGLVGIGLSAAFDAAQEMPEVKAPEPEAPPVSIPEPEMAPPEPANVTTAGNTDGIVVVNGEPGVHTTKWLEENEKAAASAGMPVELVAMLREHLKIDNTNVLVGMDMVREAMQASIASAESLVRSLMELDAAIELIKVEG